MASKVQHGRRKGSPKVNPKLKPGGMILPNETDLRQVTIIGKGDWERIQYQLNKRQIEKDRLQKEREAKQELHQLSVNAVQGWGNTIKGQRNAKLHARRIREEKEEEDRKILDIEEAKYMAQKRKEAIEKAKTQQYYQTDRVKGFHSALLLTEVLKEREAQLELKRLKALASDGQDREIFEHQRRLHEESLLRDQAEARKRIDEAKENASFQTAQIRQHLKSAEKKKEEDKIEGEELKRLAAQYELEKMRLADIRGAESKQLMADQLRQLSDIKRLAQLQAEHEEEEDEECRIFAAAKRKMMKLRAQKEKEIRREKLARLDQIRAQLGAQNQQRQDDEDQRIQNALNDAEAKQKAQDAAKARAQHAMQESINEHRTQQLKQKEADALALKKQQLEEMIAKREADAVFHENEGIKSRKRFEENKGVQLTLLQQAESRRKKDLDAREQALAQDERNNQLVELEEKQFQEYAKKVIDHAEARGRNTYPLKMAAKEGAGGGLGPVFPGKGGIRPSYMVSDQSGVQMAHYQRSSTDETKQTIYGDGKTDKRLGFVW